ncbi:GNAT family N-acetyltransferase [Flavobacterium cerinum]|uniref:N-acetyltransferase n=1 Tax=Flavobacterium cerinum TaxID=2502784 RepID=A0A3S3TVJ3_9FLAO|nr:GNAT family N-acetyltransferase [Flavobacterium cerinum]RWW93799.1 N-acetyltransferase [Flavobacterium cerinum]
MNKLNVIENTIPVTTYRTLRVNSGLSPKTIAAAEIGLANSLYSVMIANEGNEVIGMGRIIGDGGCFCQIVDICVLPEYQGQGIGKLIMENLMNYINNELPESCYISLIADGDADKLYAKYGFKDTMPKSKGMALKK